MIMLWDAGQPASFLIVSIYHVTYFLVFSGMFFLPSTAESPANVLDIGSLIS